MNLDRRSVLKGMGVVGVGSLVGLPAMADGSLRPLRDYLEIASARGFRLDLSEENLHQFIRNLEYPVDPVQIRTKLEAWLKSARAQQKDGRVYPQYYVHSDRIVMRNPNLLVGIHLVPQMSLRTTDGRKIKPYRPLRQGEFEVVSPGPVEACLYASMCGDHSLAAEFLDPKNRISEVLLRRMGLSSIQSDDVGYKNAAKMMFFCVMYGAPPLRVGVESTLYPKFVEHLPQLIQPSEGQQERIRSMRQASLGLLQRMAADAETDSSKHRLVGFLPSEILVEADDPEAVQDLCAKARDHLRTLCEGVA